MSLPLVTIDQMLDRLQNVDAGEMRQTVYNAASGATSQLQDLFRLGSLTQATGVVEEFWVDYDSAQKLATQRYLTFRLSNAFVDEGTTPVALRYGMSPDELDAAADIDAKFLKIDQEKGLVRFDTYGFQDSFISVYRRRIPADYFSFLFRITYDHGLATAAEGGGEGNYYTGVPDWLVEAALIKGREVYQIMNPSKDVDPKAFAYNMSLILPRHIRLFYGALDPVV